MTSAFYVTGGTLRPDAPSYVERQADRDLLEGLRRGEFCYVLTSRQMGKSSLMVRAAHKLREEGVNAVVLDLTAIGQNLAAEQWYDGLIVRMGHQLGLEDVLDEFWRKEGGLSPVQRFFATLREVVLAHRPGPLVVFVDEIDTVRSLPFSTDEFFAAIRECYNRRAEDPEFDRITFCLLGVATPSDLIRDTRMTPFNIGQRIELNDFNREEVLPLARGFELIPGLGEPGQVRHRAARALLERVLYWTSGHPYLTQRLCHVVAEAHSNSKPAQHARLVLLPSRLRHAPLVDRLCEDLFLSSRARECDDNLIFVRERLLRSEANPADLLTFYRKIRVHGHRVPNDETNPLESHLRLAGIVRVAGGALALRNRIYRRAFNRRWIAIHTPDAERRRQREAYIKGIVRATVAIACLAGLIFFQMNRAQRAATQRVAKSYLGTGYRLAAERDLLGSLTWYSRALDLNAGSAELEQGNRIAIALTLRQCPKPLKMWFTEAEAYCAAFSPDGAKVVVVGGSGHIAVWNAHTGETLLRFRSGTNEVTSARFSPDGRWIVSAAEDGWARVWEAQTGVLLKSFSHPAGLHGAVLDPTAKHLLSACADQRAVLWDLARETVVREFTNCHTAGVRSAEFSPDGRFLVTGGEDGTAQVWEVATGKPIGSRLRVTSWVYDAQFSPDGRSVVTASFDNLACLWDAKSGELIKRFDHEGPVRSVAFSPDGRYLATACWDLDFSTRFWDVKTGEIAAPPIKHSSVSFSVSFSPNGARLLTTTLQGVVSLWSLASMNWLPPLVEDFYSPDGKRFVTVRGDQIRLWDALSREPLTQPIRTPQAVERVLLSLEGNRALALWPPIADEGQTNFHAQLWEMQEGRTLGPMFECGPADRFFLSRDADRLFTTKTDRGTVWNTRSGKSLAGVRTAPEQIRQACFSPDGARLVFVCDRIVRVWDYTDRRPAIDLPHTHTVVYAEFSPDGRKVVTACRDTTLAERSAQLWDAETGQKLSPPLQHRDGVHSASFSPDGKRVVSASEDRQVVVWDATTGKRLLRPMRHKHEVYSASYSPDGHRIVTGSRDKTARVWDVEVAEPLTPPLRHSSTVVQARFVADGRAVITETIDGRRRYWDLSPDTRPTEFLQSLCRLLSSHEVDQFGDPVPLDKQELRKLWDLLPSRYPADFSTSPQDVRDWHDRECALAELQKDWRAALFHLDPLLRLDPTNSVLLERQARFLAQEEALGKHEPRPD